MSAQTDGAAHLFLIGMAAGACLALLIIRAEQWWIDRRNRKR